LLQLLSVFLPYRGPWPLHNPILLTGFGVLVQEVVEHGLECGLLVPLFIHLPFASLWALWLDHSRSSVLRGVGRTGPTSGQTISSCDQIGSRSVLTMVLCCLLGSAVAR
jgi:hypothetical protein